MDQIAEKAAALYGLEGCDLAPVPGHSGGRNRVLVVRRNGENRSVLRLSTLEDRTEEDLLAELEFVRYLKQNGAPVADVIPSPRGRLAETVEAAGITARVCLFEYAKGMLLYDNGYRYRDGAPLEEYFFNTGKALGAIHRLSKVYAPVHRRPDYFDKYNMAYIDRLIADSLAPLKEAIARRLEAFRLLPADPDRYGLVHFDFSDGNFHIDMATGAITVFDFDNCMACWYMFDLANLWTHGEGWYRHEADPERRMAGMRHYFDTILAGYRSETDLPEDMLEKLPLFIDMVLIENIVDVFECAAREGEDPDAEDYEDAADCLVRGIPYAGIGAGR